MPQLCSAINPTLEALQIHPRGFPGITSNEHKNVIYSMYLNLYIAQGDKAKGNFQIECHKCHKDPKTGVLD
jgi:hypothetical protein